MGKGLIQCHGNFQTISQKVVDLPNLDTATQNSAHCTPKELQESLKATMAVHFDDPSHVVIFLDSITWKYIKILAIVITCEIYLL